MRLDERFPNFAAALRRSFLATMSAEKVAWVYRSEPTVTRQEAARRYALGSLQYPPWHPCFADRIFATVPQDERQAFENYWESYDEKKSADMCQISADFKLKSRIKVI